MGSTEVSPPIDVVRPWVTLIVPVFNVAPYLAACLASLSGQTLAEVEIIVIDDASTDGSRDILSRWAPHSGDVRVILNERNIGASASRNRGLAMARGVYVGFVDADDFIDKEMIELMAAAARTCDADIAVCGYRALGESPRIDCHPVALPTDRCLEGDELRLLLDRAHRDKLVWFSWRYLFLKAFLDRLGYRFDEAQVFGEDVLFNAAALNAARRVIALPDCLYVVRSRPNSVTSTRGKPDLLGGLERQHAELQSLYIEIDMPYRIETDYLVYVRHHLLPMLLVNEWDLAADRATFRVRVRRLRASPLVLAASQLSCDDSELTRGTALLLWVLRSRYSAGLFFVQEYFALTRRSTSR